MSKFRSEIIQEAIVRFTQVSSLFIFFVAAHPKGASSEDVCASSIWNDFRSVLAEAAKTGDYRPVHPMKERIIGQSCDPNKILEIVEAAGFEASLTALDGDRHVVRGQIDDGSFLRWLFTNSRSAQAEIEIADGKIQRVSIGPKK